MQQWDEQSISALSRDVKAWIQNLSVSPWKLCHKFNSPLHPACDQPLSTPQVFISERQGISKVKEAPKAPR